ncbi:MAG TPA: hypothetical protein GX017_06690 [Clostridiales bacterium]|jgi:hypothetical protein|nr:hypothetical protein [Clostridiales bacterium]
MRAAKIVYIMLAVFLLLPWFAHNIKAYLNLRNNKKKFSAARILNLILVSAVIITGVYAHYRFTIAYQVPLVAERAGMVFSQRVQGKLDLPGYRKEMQKQKLGDHAEIKTISDEELEKLGFQNRNIILSLSERTYPKEDGGVVIYLMYDDGQESLYSVMQLTQHSASWKVDSHEVLSHEAFSELNEEMKIKFYQVQS